VFTTVYFFPLSRKGMGQHGNRGTTRREFEHFLDTGHHNRAKGEGAFLLPVRSKRFGGILGLGSGGALDLLDGWMVHTSSCSQLTYDSSVELYFFVFAI